MFAATAWAKKAMSVAIAGDFAKVLDDPSRALLNRIFELTTAVVAVDPAAERIARRDVGFNRRPHVVPGKAEPQRRAVKFRDRLAGFEAELCVKAQGAIVIGGLQQPDPGDVPFSAALEDGEHQAAAD